MIEIERIEDDYLQVDTLAGWKKDVISKLKDFEKILSFDEATLTPTISFLQELKQVCPKGTADKLDRACNELTEAALETFLVSTKWKAYTTRDYIILHYIF